jgi:hypothetical protein
MGFVLGLLTSLAGRALDRRWHATHDEFETGADQLQAHWLAWLGAAVLLVTAAMAWRQPWLRHPLVAAALVGAIGYAVVAGWHFWEHSQLRDPDLPHVLLALSQVTLLVGTGGSIWLLLRPRGLG